MNRLLITIIYVSLLLINCLPVYSQKKTLSNPFKKQKVEIVDVVEPDQISHKSKPDRHPKPLPMPMLKGSVDNGPGLHGIDVSHYQGKINWDEVVHDSKAGYVYLKATEGTTIVDDTYARNFKECKRVSLKVGSYIFFHPQYSAKAQFDKFVSVVDTRQQDLLPLVDAESMRGATISVFQQRLLELCMLLEKEYGKKPLIYTGQNFYNKYISGHAILASYPYFIAKYDTEPPVLTDNQDYLMWQYSAKGSVKGIRGYVDMSHFVGKHGINEILYKR